MAANSTRPITADTRLVYDSEGHIIGMLPAADRPNRLAALDSTGNALLAADGGVLALTETIGESLATASATTVILNGSGRYYAYRCTVAAGNITVYDNTSAAGKVLVPTTALTVGSFPIYGAGTNKLLTVSTGITVVLSDAAVVYVAYEAD